MDLQRIKVEVLLVTPEMARDFLTHNISNRKLDRHTVALYSRVLKEGLFLLSNDAICFDLAGTLLNGQHRLTACVETGISFYCIVARGVPTESYVIMDNGKNRTASDVLYVQDVASATAVAAAIKRYINLCRHLSTIADAAGGAWLKISNAEIEQEYKRDTEFWNSMTKWGSNLRAHGKWKLLNGSEYIAVSAYLILEKKHNDSFVKDFFEQIEGRQEPSTSVITLLQMKLNDSKRNPQRRLLPFVVQKLVIKAWNAYVTGKTYQNFFYNEKSDKDIWFV